MVTENRTKFGGIVDGGEFWCFGKAGYIIEFRNRTNIPIGANRIRIKISENAASALTCT